MKPVGAERNHYIAEHFLKWRHCEYQGYWVPIGATGTLADVVFDRELPKWSTDDAAALQLANVELPKRGYSVTWRRLRDGNSFRVNCALRHRVTVTGNGYDADVVSDSFADAVSQVCVMVAESEAQGKGGAE